MILNGGVVYNDGEWVISTDVWYLGSDVNRPCIQTYMFHKCAGTAHTYIKDGKRCSCGEQVPEIVQKTKDLILS